MPTPPRATFAISYCSIAIVFALLYAAIDPPFQAPDEVGHYWRAASLAGGNITLLRDDGRPSALLPRHDETLVASTWMPLAGHSELRYDSRRFIDAWRQRRETTRVRLHFPANFTPIPNAPQAVATFCGELVRLPPLATFYLGRILNALTGIALVTLAIVIAPAHRYAFAAVGLTPMFLFLAGSFSPDVTTIGGACVATALALRVGSGDTDRRLLVALSIAAMLLGLCKPVYFLLPLVAWVRMRSRHAIVLLIAIASGVAISAQVARTNYFSMRRDVVIEPTAQMAFIAHHPFQFAGVVFRDYAQHAPRYTAQLVGNLGWLDVPLPRAITLLVLTLFLLIAISAEEKLATPVRIVAVACLAATLLIISASQYLSWTPIAATTVDGIQGRYFLPIVPLLLVAFARPMIRLERMTAIVMAIGIVANVAGLIALWLRYYS